jgi:hypothetical protein
VPIDRDGKHWCNPGDETPDENGLWVCPGCGLIWSFDADQSLWTLADPNEPAVPEEPAEPADPGVVPAEPADPVDPGAVGEPAEPEPVEPAPISEPETLAAAVETAVPPASDAVPAPAAARRKKGGK